MKPQSQEQRQIQLEKQAEILAPLGFEPYLDFGYGPRFRHRLLPGKSFDFSAASLEGIPALIFEAGKKAGASEAQARMRQALGVE